jgi:hypothetical protein
MYSSMVREDADPRGVDMQTHTLIHTLTRSRKQTPVCEDPAQDAVRPLRNAIEKSNHTHIARGRTFCHATLAKS